ncbi:UEV domain-containing protein [Apiospora arundinis]
MSETQEHDSATQPDVIVVGGGLAGLCAALAAAEHGATVLVLDAAHGGGSTAISGGVLYAGGGTQQQREAGYGYDTPDNMFRYLREEIGLNGPDAPVGEATLRRFCDESVARMEWLQRHGVAFAANLCPFRTSYPTDRYGLYFSGNERAHPYAAVAEPAPRGHRVVGGGATSGMKMTGNVLWEALYRSAVQMGVKFEFASRAKELLFDSSGTGAVQGVRYLAMDPATADFARHKCLTASGAGWHQISVQFLANWYDRRAEALWKHNAKERTVTAPAVILSAGGFGMNHEMMKDVPHSSRVAPLGTAGDDGSGIQLGQSVGGSVSHMHRLSVWRLMYPPEALVEGIVVSPKGERIAGEDLYGASLSNAMIEKANGSGHLILDSTQWAKVKSQMNEQTQMPWRAFIYYLVYWAHQRASSLETLAHKLGVDSATMEATVGAYNDAITSNKSDPVGKLCYRSVIATGPFYGIDVSLRPSGMLMAPALPLGGLRVEESTGLERNGDLFE